MLGAADIPAKERVRLQPPATVPATRLELAPAAGSRAQAAALRILVVDDNPDATDSLTLLIRAWGHDVRGVYGAAEALAVAADFRPGLVLPDLGLPVMNGFEVARLLRDIPRLEHCVIVAVTGAGQDEDRQRTHAAGFAAHLVKPVEVDLLRRTIANIAPAPPAASA